MDSFRSKDFSIVQAYKENEFQKVFVGIDNRNNQPVVINLIHTFENNYAWSMVELDYKSIFSHAVHFEKRQDQVVLVTRAKDGISLSTYLEDHAPSFSERVHLANEYLESIQRYDPLPNNIKAILVDESQIILDSRGLSFDELIIFNEKSYENNSFRDVVHNIITVLKKLTHIPSINYNELTLYAQVIGFLDGLQINTSTYGSIEEIYDDFKKLDLGPMSKFHTKIGDGSPNIGEGPARPSYSKAGPDNLVGRKVSSIDEEALKAANSSNRSFPLLATGVVGVVIVAGLLTSKFLPSLKAKYWDPALLPKEAVEFSEAPVDESLNQVLDPSEDQVSQEDEAWGEESKELKGPNSHITYLSPSIEEDPTTARSGDYSLKISSESQGPHKISIEQGSIEKDSHFLMWLKLSGSDRVKVTVRGYSEDKLSFQKSITHKPLQQNNWELLQLAINADIKDSVDIIFEDIEGTLWVDKIVIDMFK